MKERKSFHARVLVHNFLNALKSLGGSAAMLIFQDSFGCTCVIYISV